MLQLGIAIALCEKTKPHAVKFALNSVRKILFRPLYCLEQYGPLLTRKAINGNCTTSNTAINSSI